ncbi:hypothetical protein [Pseudonocardia humida]|uniref:Uncharacterized protein n=1 Tax=Pseudonocardia humida TaxID=2800819 RepID=A0ABT1ACP6_9PSEU|nr:hypothetical protein [Pseudonocardia humida]MCO1660810.1 hypothetical protein [Pseudonocardia humida]
MALAEVERQREQLGRLGIREAAQGRPARPVCGRDRFDHGDIGHRAGQVERKLGLPVLAAAAQGFRAAAVGGSAGRGIKPVAEYLADERVHEPATAVGRLDQVRGGGLSQQRRAVPSVEGSHRREPINLDVLAEHRRILEQGLALDGALVQPAPHGLAHARRRPAPHP